MAYIRKNEMGEIITYCSEMLEGFEEVAGDDAEVLQFLSRERDKSIRELRREAMKKLDDEYINEIKEFNEREKSK